MNMYIQRLIMEQFNIANMDLNNTGKKHKSNIFNKQTIDPKKIYNYIINDAIDSYNRVADKCELEDWEIAQMNNLISVVKPDANVYHEEGVLDDDSKSDFIKVIMYYSKYYPNESLNWLDVSDITDMSFAFSGDYLYVEWVNNHFNGDISRWDVSNVKDMKCMFQCSDFNGDISNWDVSAVINMEKLFCSSEFNNDISRWDVHNVTDMSYMFCNSMFNGDISKWDVSKVRDNFDMFSNCFIKEEYKPIKFFN